MARKNTPGIGDSKLDQILQDMSEQPTNSWMDILAEDARLYEKYRQLREWESAGLPEEQYGLMGHFLRGFLTEEMREIFPEIAAAFLENEPYLRDPARQDMLNSLYEPVRTETHLEDPFVFLVLQLMVVCAQSGSAYSRELLLGLYKTYYRREYNVLKRYRSISFDDLFDFMEMEAVRRGIPAEEFDPEMENDFSDAVMARLVILCGLMGISLDQSWNSPIAFANKHEIEYRTFWKMLDCIQYEEPLQEKMMQKYEAASARLSELLPYVNWFFLNEDVSDIEDPNQLIALCKHLIERAMDERMINSDLFIEDFRFDLRKSAVSAIIDMPEQVNIEEEADKVVLLAVIRYLAEVTAALEEEREKELRLVLHFRYQELVTDEMLLKSGVSDETIERFREQRAAEDSCDPRIEKLLSKADAAREKSASGRTSSVQPKTNAGKLPQTNSGKAAVFGTNLADRRLSAEKAKQNSRPGTKVSAQNSRLSAEEAAQNSRPSTKESAQNRRLSAEEAAQNCRLSEEESEQNSRRILELKGKLRRQHALLEESRKREIALQAHMDEWKRDQTELIRLREFVHSLESDSFADDETSADDRIAFLAEKKIMIVGGHENWIKKIRRIFPGWVYIGARSGLGLKGAVQSCDKLYFYTDICGHSLYYKFLAAAAEYKKPYAFLHGTNLDRTVRSIYEDFKEQREGTL